jgi:hypothetical protein
LIHFVKKSFERHFVDWDLPEDINLTIVQEYFDYVLLSVSHLDIVWDSEGKIAAINGISKITDNQLIYQSIICFFYKLFAIFIFWNSYPFW